MSESQNASNSQLPSESSDFVGRSREMAILEAAWARAADGHGQLAMPAGEPGIGKTRTAKELAQRVQEMNGQVLWGWCYEGEGAPSYWPWVDALRAYVRRAEPELLRAQLGTGAAAISRDPGKVGRHSTSTCDGAGPSKIPSLRFHHRIFAVAGTSPLLLVLDDLHWADRPTLLLLEFAAQQLTPAAFSSLGPTGTMKPLRKVCWENRWGACLDWLHSSAS